LYLGKLKLVICSGYQGIKIIFAFILNSMITRGRRGRDRMVVGSRVIYIYSNISVISWRSILFVEETGVPGETGRPVANNRITREFMSSGFK
jgi:hypothetical protein